MNRQEKSKDLRNEYFLEDNMFENDPDLKEIYHQYVFGDVYHHGSLQLGLREMITIACLTTSYTLETLENHIHCALKANVTPIQIKEVIYQCSPYIGFLKVSSALKIVNKVFKQEQISLPLESMSTVNEETRFEHGFDVQSEIFGREHIQANHDQAPQELKHIQDYLSAYCFGDFYTRKGLDLKQRELMTFIMIATLGGCENQLRGHTQANINVGNTRETLIEAITQCQPYIGFPRTLNAIGIINEVTLK